MATTPFIHDVPAAEALAAWRAACAAAGCPSRVEAVRLGLHEAVGRVTAEPVWATRSSPSFDASAMDGIAVRAADTVGASESTPVFLDRGSYVVLDTGDPMPEGFDAVVMREHVHYDEAGRAELRGAVAPYQHVRSIGEDVSAAELLLPTGHRLRAVDVAAAAAAGATDALVHRAPVVAVLPTGDEIRPVGTDAAPGVILDTNSLMLVAQAEAAGCAAWRGEIVPDDP
jgi:putative molybdopterin biosynthesis protein